MHKTFTGVIVSMGMLKTVVVEVTRQKPHPLYRKLLKRSHRFKADPKSYTLSIGDTVRITETRPMGHGKHFAVVEVLTKTHGKNKKEQKEESTE